MLRGFALLGILVMNMPYFSWGRLPGQTTTDIWPQWWNVAETWAAQWLFAGKFNSLFSFLFGIGFALQLERLGRAGGVPRYLRRLGALLGFGLVHAFLIWEGDVLITYVAIGFVLLPLRHLSSKAVLVVAVLAMLAGPVSTVVYVSATSDELKQQRKAEEDQLLIDENAALSGGSYSEVTRLRVRVLKEYYLDPWGAAWHGQMLGTALLGLLAARRRLYVMTPQSNRFLKRSLVGFGLTWLCAIVLYSIFRAQADPEALPGWKDAVQHGAFVIQRPALMLVYASIIALILQWPAVHKRLGGFAYAGRMPLTNYLGQSVVCTMLFYGYGLGLYDQLGPAVGFGIALILFAAQVIISRGWLQRFSFGPLEWLWRLAIYGRNGLNRAVAKQTVIATEPAAGV